MFAIAARVAAVNLVVLVIVAAVIGYSGYRVLGDFAQVVDQQAVAIRNLDEISGRVDPNNSADQVALGGAKLTAIQNTIALVSLRTNFVVGLLSVFAAVIAIGISMFGVLIGAAAAIPQTKLPPTPISWWRRILRALVQ